jgi:3-isopropylmalate/(R)-2-methylmalate dehydratase small subunit
MEKFVRLRGIAAALMRPNIDTDIIIPSREITSPGREGFGDKAFAPWRYVGSGREENPEFVLNREPYRHAAILVSGANFGCGSSREMAVWALQQFGFRCIIAPSFGAIFADNCFRNGLLPISLPKEIVAELAAHAESPPHELEIDLTSCEVSVPERRRYTFAIGRREREMLLRGLDPISLTLLHQSKIEDFARSDRLARPWIWSLAAQPKPSPPDRTT